MKRIRMIALDLDGTVFDGDKKVTKHTQEILEEAIRRGIVVFPCTGRPWTGIPEEIRKIRGMKYAVTSNGARTVKFDTGETIRENCLARAVIDFGGGWFCFFFGCWRSLGKVWG